MPSVLESISVYIATPSVRAGIPIPTTLAYLDTQEACLKHGIDLDINFMTGSLPHEGRSLLANVFLKSRHNRLFFIDDDIVWSPIDFVKLLGHSLKHPCVVGIYPARREPPAYYARLIPGNEPDANGLVEIEGTGLGFACIRREVIENLAKTAPVLSFASRPGVPAIFRCDSHNGASRGEDYAFWADVSAAGFKIMADATITLGHIGPKIYRSKLAGLET